MSMHLTRLGVATLDLKQVDVNDLALNTTIYYASDLSYVTLDIGLSSALFGILTLLVIVAVVFLSRKGLKSRPVKILLPSTLLLYGSTALHIASLASYVSSVDHLVAQARSGIFSDTFTATDVASYEADVLKQSWMMTMALGVNIIIGDSIVWWRVCAVWQNRVVNYLGPILIVLVMGFGLRAIFGVHGCIDPCQQPRIIFQDGFFWTACSALTVVVNILATVLIGYKAWLHRQLLHRHLSHGRRKSRVMNSLALLVESGTIYCLLLVIVFVAKMNSALLARPDAHQSTFIRVIAHYTYACFTPIIGIYPVLIVVIVALNRSPIEHGLSGGGGSPVRATTTQLDLNFRAATTTTSTVEITDATQMQYIQNDEEGPADTKLKQGTVTV